MRSIILFIACHCLAIYSFAQKAAPRQPANPYAATDKIALQLPDSLTKTTDGIAGYFNTHFQKDEDKARAIFIWIASNIQYDLNNMFAINFYEKKEQKVAKPLMTRKGICENYAALFQEVCTKADVKAVVVEGYTKQNGFTDYLPHAWNAAMIDGEWFVFDATWGSGYINNNKFTRKINNDFFKAKPSAIIKSHMPFDPLWQFLEYPVSRQAFSEGNVQEDKTADYFSYKDSIVAYEGLEHLEQLEASARRIEKNGVNHSLVFDRLQHVRMELEHAKNQQTVELYNSAVADFNEGISSMNVFINYRNKQFTPAKKDPEIQAMIDMVADNFKAAREKLVKIQNPDASLLAMIQQAQKSINDASGQLRDQQEWLKKYFSKGKIGRKSMFYKITYMGVPVN